MNVWFIRSNGETGHNKPGTPGFVLRFQTLLPKARKSCENRDQSLPWTHAECGRYPAARAAAVVANRRVQFAQS